MRLSPLSALGFSLILAAGNLGIACKKSPEETEVLVVGALINKFHNHCEKVMMEGKASQTQGRKEEGNFHFVNGESSCSCDAYRHKQLGDNAPPVLTCAVTNNAEKTSVALIPGTTQMDVRAIVENPNGALQTGFSLVNTIDAGPLCLVQTPKNGIRSVDQKVCAQVLRQFEKQYQDLLSFSKRKK